MNMTKQYDRNVYELIKEIDSPSFSKTLNVGNKYVLPQLIHLFGDNILSHMRFNEFFKISETHEFKNCQIVEKPKKNIITLMQEQVGEKLKIGKIPTAVILHEEDALKLRENATHWFSSNVPMSISEKSINTITVLGKKLDVVEAVRGIQKGEVCVF